jgi:hypothetical protein
VEDFIEILTLFKCRACNFTSGQKETLCQHILAVHLPQILPQVLRIFIIVCGFFGFFKNFIHHSIICRCRSSDSTVSEDAVIESRTVATLVSALESFSHLARSLSLSNIFSLFCAIIFLAFSPFFCGSEFVANLMPQFSVNRLCVISSDMNSDSASPNMPFKFLLTPLKKRHAVTVVFIDMTHDRTKLA